MMKLASTCPNSDMGFVWGLLCLHPNTIKSSYYYYYYYSSSSSRCELVRPNSQRLMIRSLLNFTGRWNPISRNALRSWNFQNGCHCHGNREHMSKSLTSLISETAKDLAYILSRVGSIFWPKKNRERMVAIFKMAADKNGKISMFSDFNEKEIDI